MKKNDFCLILCFALSITMITAVIFGLDNDRTNLTSDLALNEAERSLNGYCERRGGACDMKLVDAYAPKENAAEPEKANWNFRFYSRKGELVTVEVRDDGETRMMSTLKDGGDGFPRR